MIKLYEVTNCKACPYSEFIFEKVGKVKNAVYYCKHDFNHSRRIPDQTKIAYFCKLETKK